MNLEAKIKTISAVAEAVFGSGIAGLVGKTVANHFFRKHELTEEQSAQLDAHFDDLSAREAVLEAEIESKL